MMIIMIKLIMHVPFGAPKNLDAFIYEIHIENDVDTWIICMKEH